MNTTEAADILYNTLIKAKHTDYMWYYDEHGVHKDLIFLLYQLRDKTLRCQYCKSPILERLDTCPHCQKRITYEDHLTKELAQ